MTTPAVISRGDPRTLALGPGYLYVGALGAAEPVDLTTPWEDVDPSFVLLGYTETGSEFNYALATGEVQVAEELDPVFVTTTGRTASVVINMAQITASHLSMAMNGGIITWGADVAVVEPPDLGTELRVMIGWEAEDHTERWIYRQCFQSGTAKLARAKGNTPTTIATTFSLEKPGTGKRLFAALMNLDPGLYPGAPARGGWMQPTGGPLAPAITGANPMTDIPAGGAAITITGTNLAGATAVDFGAVANTGAITGNTATQLTVPAPAQAAATVPITVTTPAGTSAPLVGFVYAPLVTATVAADAARAGGSAGGPGAQIGSTPGAAGATAGSPGPDAQTNP
jgi:hypothetical protein